MMAQGNIPHITIFPCPSCVQIVDGGHACSGKCQDVGKKVKALLDQKSREEMWRHAKVLAEYVKLIGFRPLPKAIRDAIKAVETLQL
jgi:hypothetical protein